MVFFSRPFLVQSLSLAWISLAVLDWGARPVQGAELPQPPVNFHDMIAGKLYRGGRPLGNSFDFLQAIGVKTVIDLQGGDLDFLLIAPEVMLAEPGETQADIARERNEVLSRGGMRFFSEPLDSLSGVTPAEGARIDQIVKMMADPALQPVYVHCAHGADRTGLVAALFRVREQGWSPEAAHQEMVDLGHDWVHEAFTGAMDSYFYQALGLSNPAAHQSSDFGGGGG